MQLLHQTISKLKGFKEWFDTLNLHESQLVLGLSGSVKHLAESCAFEKLDKQLVIVTPTLLQATQTYEELSEWYDEDIVHLFPVEESLAADFSVVSPDVVSQRIRTLDFLSRGQKGIVIVPLSGIQKLLVPVDVWKKSSIELAMGSEIESMDAFVEQLVELGYRRENMVATPGEFALRGSIVDIYPLDQEYPLRIDFFDTEVDSIRAFNAETQRSMDVIEEVRILPATDLPLQKEAVWKAQAKIHTLYEKDVKASQSPERRDQVSSIQQAIDAQLENGEIPSNLTYFLECIYPEKTSLLDYVSKDAYLIIDDYARFIEKSKSLEEEAGYWKTHHIETGAIASGLSLVQDGRKVLKESPLKRTYLAIFQKGLGRLALDAIHPITTRTMTQFFSQMPMVKVEADRWKKQGATVIVLVDDAKRAQKVEQTFADFEIKSVISNGTVLEGQHQIMVGKMHNGFELPEDKFAILTERELFNKLTKRAPRNQKISNAERLKSYTELAVGDYVVHVNHGVGVYQGMETLEIGGIHQDYMSIHYQDGGNLFVPVSQIKLVQKYVSSDAKVPKLNKLGGTEWAKTKRKVTAKIEDIADELIELYAKRDAEKGYAFSRDTVEQQEFEQAFPYTETQDQLRSVAEIKEDMQKDKPMDRLLVGDVGYGKTEVAMRAVFKAVMDGKQAAVLVPTTILAEQHYENFVQRFSDYPFKIGLLSRFRSKKEQEETIEKLRKGSVDIVIGTHRLLSKDVQFLDLGLLIVDEEQRFGVKHKERLKQLKSQVDVLTLTATPIPRTLHMSMLGVRDLSVIETPPANRYPVQTFVMEQNPMTIRDGIEREMARGGQVFYLYNRVETIEKKADELRALVPGCRVGVIHGQMSETTLENILFQFIEGEYDVLVTTTIIETGVDIPNVNTLFIENADYMGLSQLYQLRGRVGRTNRIAYAYLMYQPDKVLTEVSEKRLQAMRDFTELGSGFKIAMRDLSIRGAGNLLGKQQHGFIDSVGFDLYSQLLSEAVLKKQGKEVKSDEETVEIDLQIDAYIPSSYIQDERQKIEMYKRIRSIDSVEAYEELLDDFIDRFGDFPDEVSALAEVGLIKHYANEINAVSIKRKDNSVTITIAPPTATRLQGVPVFEALGPVKLPAQVANKGESLQILLNITQKPVDLWLEQVKLFVKTCGEILARDEEKHEEDK
ncbi:transcription-repair coupling factor [Granulicatella adiacens]|uniref:transcription-repair coupling factor n=1 Tax=Granulicatella adiacens TaxID=46124 RepID=UPI003C6EF3DD